MKYKFKLGSKIKHFDNNEKGTIVGLTRLYDVVDGDCESNEENDPWYEIEWDNGEFGAEYEGSLKKA